MSTNARLYAARDINDLRPVWELTYREYLRKGYCKESRLGQLLHFPHLDLPVPCLDAPDSKDLVREAKLYPWTTIFCLEDEHGLAGTVSVTKDGSRGLHTDAAFPSETDACRARFRRLAAGWRIVTRQGVPRRVVMQLMDVVYSWAQDQDVDAMLFTFHPRHERFYRRVFGFETLACRESQPFLKNAPVVLMIGTYQTCSVWSQYRERLLLPGRTPGGGQDD